jgi:outer membrane autotransporter protein
LGVALGGSFASVTSDKVQKGKANSFLIIGYGSYNVNIVGDDWILAGNFGYASSEYRFSRNILNLFLDSRFNGDSFFGGLDISKKFQYYQLFDVMPFASLSFITMSVDNDDDGVVKIVSPEADSVLQSLGVRFAKTTRGDFGTVRTYGASAAWIHDYESKNLSSTTTYFNLLPITAIGAVKPADRGAFGLNVNIALGHVILYGAFDCEFASKYDAETIQGGISFEF